MLIRKVKAPEDEQIKDEKHADESTSGSDLDDSGTVGPSDNAIPLASTSTSSKKKKKKRSKANKALGTLKDDSMPQTVVDAALEKVKQQGGEHEPGTDQ